MKKEPQQQEFSLLDRHFARFLGQLSGLPQQEVAPFTALIQQLSAALDSGDSCIDITGREDLLHNLPAALCISAADYQQGRHAPLVLFNGKLFLYRYFHYEFRLAQQLRVLAAQQQDLDKKGRELLAMLFPAESCPADTIDWQKKAAELAVTRRLAIISGGPGTGKTTTVMKILALLLGNALHRGEALPRIKLVAPTGKAAIRLGESVAGSSKDSGYIPDKIKEAIPCTATTLHRLLGVRYNSSRFVHNSDNPLDCSVVVVDEASMVDLALMAKLVDALPPLCRLILLGDKDQLASVESGAVLAELLAGLPDCGVQLQKSYRFDSNIKELAVAINSGDIAGAWQLVADPERTNLSLLGDNWFAMLAERFSAYMQAVQQVMASGVGDDAAASLFVLLRSFQVLCATRKGRRGAPQINSDILRILAARGFPCKGGDHWFAGRPLLITNNDYGLGLFNGDIGICLPSATGEKEVWFEQHDGGFITVPYGRLPGHETSFAITIHKSQGSEFAEVAVLLPERVHRGLSRELLYTGITRAKNKVWLLAEREIFAAALGCPVCRQSGLRQLLKGFRKNS